MKYLLNRDFKVIRKGSHVKVDETVGEMLFDDECEEYSGFTMGMMEEVANSNKLRHVGGKNKTQFKSTLVEALRNMENVAEQNGPTESEIAEQIIREGFENDTSDDDMMVQMVTQGVSFKNAMKLFKQTVEKLGLRVSTKDVKEQASKLLDELGFNPEGYDEVQDMLGKIREQTQADEKQANSAIRAYCKANEIALPKKPKTAKRGATGYRGQVFDWIVSNPNADQTELTEYINSLGKDGERQAKRFMPIVEVCHQFAKANAELFLTEGEETEAA